MVNFVTSTALQESLERVMTPAALDFVARLHRTFDPTRQALLVDRKIRQRAFDAGATPDFLPETRAMREGGWQVAPAPADLQDRRVEITGPAERKMMINALNSDAKVFMADLEDALSPTWENVIEGQRCLQEAVRRSLRLDDAASGKAYNLGDALATLVVRPRGLHLHEKHMSVDGEAVSASLFDFGHYFFHNARELLSRDTGPYFYLPKLESHHEARFWNDVFGFAQDALGIPRGTVRATVLIETLPAAFEMDEILYELREHASGLNAGRWDYIFSYIKTFRAHTDKVLPNRAQVTMTVPFMHAYTELLIATCHRRGAHAIGGMAAFIPNRKNPEITERALAKVAEDKRREAAAGCDGTWVAHPDLIPVAQAAFDTVLGGKPNQKERGREEVRIEPGTLIDSSGEGGEITEAGVLENIGVALQYLNAWLTGIGAAAINNLMEDAATAEIARAQLWQWRRHGVVLTDGEPFTAARYQALKGEVMATLAGPRLESASRLLDELVLEDDFIAFLTLPSYELLE